MSEPKENRAEEHNMTCDVWATDTCYFIDVGDSSFFRFSKDNWGYFVEDAMIRVYDGTLIENLEDILDSVMKENQKKRNEKLN